MQILFWLQVLIKVHDSLFATAIVFDNGLKRAAIITAEIINLSHESWEEITSKIQREAGIEHEYILLSQAHNHGGPFTRVFHYNRKPTPEEFEKDENLVSYYKELEDKLIEVTLEAANNLQSALIGSEKGICKMSMNRRAISASGFL